MRHTFIFSLLLIILARSEAFENEIFEEKKLVVLVQMADIKIINCTFSNITDIMGGGAVCIKCYNEQEIFININECVFSENSATKGFGGALYIECLSNRTTDVIIGNCSFYQNTCPKYGGAVCILAGSIFSEEDPSDIIFDFHVQVNSCIFADNSLKENGGSFCMADMANAERLRNKRNISLMLEGNQFIDSKSDFGVVYLSALIVEIRNNNFTRCYGQAINFLFGPFTMTECIFDQCLNPNQGKQLPSFNYYITGNFKLNLNHCIFNKCNSIYLNTEAGDIDISNKETIILLIN